jgi:hypothetical protein
MFHLLVLFMNGNPSADATAPPIKAPATQQGLAFPLPVPDRAGVVSTVNVRIYLTVKQIRAIAVDLGCAKQSHLRAQLFGIPFADVMTLPTRMNATQQDQVFQLTTMQNVLLNGWALEVN